MKVLNTFFKAGLKLETFRELLGFWLTSPSSLLLLSLMCINVGKIQNRLRFGAKWDRIWSIAKKKNG